MASVLSKCTGRRVVYEEVEAPPSTDMQELWQFLRRGGFAHSTNTVLKVTGKPATDFTDFVKSLLSDLRPYHKKIPIPEDVRLLFAWWSVERICVKRCVA
eukprot:scaffold280716_cov32-Prasinocladus_malaysianus.AAC.2